MPPKVLVSLRAWLGSIWPLRLILLLPTRGRDESPGQRLQATPRAPHPHPPAIPETEGLMEMGVSRQSWCSICSTIDISKRMKGFAQI